MGSDLLKVIQQVGREKNINPEVLIEAVESALLLASKKKFGSIDNLVFHLNRETGEVELFSVRKVTEEIKDREREILNSRFGIEKGKKQTLAAIARKLGVSRERIRQIEEEALKKLRSFVKERKEEI